jgi:hydrogenase expression/formation protein HypD
MTKNIITQLIKNINAMANEDTKIMEVCGSHTQVISNLGLRTILSNHIKLISGPGCPVCVTEEDFIDKAIEILTMDHVVLVTFGDLMKVSGRKGSLLEEKRKGKEIKIIYSPLELIHIAEANKNKIFVFLGVGFETTAPIIALTIKSIADRGIENVYFHVSLKRMEPILHYILQQPNHNIKGFICPGHVATIQGAEYFRFISETYGITAAVCGFEDIDIISGIYYILKNKNAGTFINLYERCVQPQGNIKGKLLMDDVFQITDGNWRGIGFIEQSAFIINEKYNKYDVNSVFGITKQLNQENNISSTLKNECICKDILLGYKTPEKCQYFSGGCNPDKPLGPCMISSEGACAIAYRYREVSLEWII